MIVIFVMDKQSPSTPKDEQSPPTPTASDVGGPASDVGGSVSDKRIRIYRASTSAVNDSSTASSPTNVLDVVASLETHITTLRRVIEDVHIDNIQSQEEALEAEQSVLLRLQRLLKAVATGDAVVVGDDDHVEVTNQSSTSLTLKCAAISNLSTCFKKAHREKPGVKELSLIGVSFFQQYYVSAETKNEALEILKIRAERGSVHHVFHAVAQNCPAMTELDLAFDVKNYPIETVHWGSSTSSICHSLRVLKLTVGQFSLKDLVSVMDVVSALYPNIQHLTINVKDQYQSDEKSIIGSVSLQLHHLEDLRFSSTGMDPKEEKDLQSTVHELSPQLGPASSQDGVYFFRRIYGVSGDIRRIPLETNRYVIHTDPFELQLDHLSWGVLTMIYNRLYPGGNSESQATKRMLCTPFIPKTISENQDLLILHVRFYNKLPGLAQKILAEEESLKYKKIYPDQELIVKEDSIDMSISCQSKELPIKQTKVMTKDLMQHCDITECMKLLPQRSLVTLIITQERKITMEFWTDIEVYPFLKKSQDISGIIKDALFDELSNKIPAGKYAMFCNQMGVDYNEAKNALTRYKEDYSVAVRDILSQWDLRMKGVTRKQLEDALDGAEVGGLCSIVKKHYKKEGLDV